jgi:hypothetical protein
MSAMNAMEPYQKRWLIVLLAVYGALTLALVAVLVV